MPEVDVLWEPPGAEDEALVVAMRERGAAALVASGAGSRALSLVLTDSTHMREHNRKWRGMDSPTDVLSFPMDEGDPLAHGEEAASLGDVVLDVETAASQAEAHGWAVLDELTFLLVHGVCHLRGFDHCEPAESAAMRAEERRLLAAVAPGQERPPTAY